MAIPTFQEAAAAFATITSGGALTPDLPVTGLAAGDLFIAHVTHREASNPTTPSGWTLQDGPDTFTVARAFYYYRVSDGTESGTIDFGSPATVVTRIARVYRFRGTHATTMFEGGGFGQANNTTILDTGVTTTDVDRLAVQLVAVADDQAVGSFTGETGGDWTETVAEFTTTLGGDGCLQLQTAEMAAAGTIDGGSITIGSAQWGVHGFALIPAAAPATGNRLLIGVG